VSDQGIDAATDIATANVISETSKSNATKETWGTTKRKVDRKVCVQSKYARKSRERARDRIHKLEKAIGNLTADKVEPERSNAVLRGKLKI
jgi:hypothetical protein